MDPIQDNAPGVTKVKNNLSIKDAVRIATSNNFMGITCSNDLLQKTPALIEAIKAAGLVLVADASSKSDKIVAGSSTLPYSTDGIDGVLNSDSVLRFRENAEM